MTNCFEPQKGGHPLSQLISCLGIAICQRRDFHDTLWSSGSVPSALLKPHTLLFGQLTLAIAGLITKACGTANSGLGWALAVPLGKRRSGGDECSLPLIFSPQLVSSPSVFKGNPAGGGLCITGRRGSHVTVQPRQPAPSSGSRTDFT